MATPEPLAVIPLQYENATAAQARPTKRLGIVAIAAWLACAVALGLIVAVDVESVMVTGPVITVLGLLLAVWALLEHRPPFLVAGAAHIAICLLFVVLVNVRQWSPREATLPFTVMGAMHVIGSGAGTAWLLLRGRGPTL